MVLVELVLIRPLRCTPPPSLPGNNNSHSNTASVTSSFSGGNGQLTGGSTRIRYAGGVLCIASEKQRACEEPRSSTSRFQGPAVSVAILVGSRCDSWLARKNIYFTSIDLMLLLVSPYRTGPQHCCFAVRSASRAMARVLMGY